MRLAMLMAGLAAVVGCARATVISAPEDAGMLDGSGADATNEPDMSVSRIDMGGEPRPGGECDQQDDCNECGACAADQDPICGVLWQDCNASADCLALIDCTDGCTTNECFQSCGAAHPDSAEAVTALYRCLICDACSADCRDGYPTWCETPPF